MPSQSKSQTQATPKDSTSVNKSIKKLMTDEERQKIEDETFSISIEELSKILDQYRNRLNGDDDLQEIKSLGDESGILQKLKTDKNGISGDEKKMKLEIERRIAHFDSNKIYEKPIPPFCSYVLESLNDTMLQVLIVAAIVQIVLGATLSDDPSRDWVDGVSILVAVVVVVTVGSVTNWKKEHQFKDLSDEQKKSTKFGIKRNGVVSLVQSDDILVGDILAVNYGDILPADALLIEGNNIKADESSLTGESKELKKMSYQECLNKKEEEIKSGSDIKKVTLPSPVLLSGTNIVSGSGLSVVIAVGKNSQKGKIRNMVQNAQEDAQTPLAEKLEKIAGQIGYFGIAAGIVTLIALFIRFGISYHGRQKTYNNTASTKSLLSTFVQNNLVHYVNETNLMHEINIKLTDPKLQIGSQVLDIILLCVSIIVVAIPEGLPLAVTLALAFSIRKMMDKQNLVRKMHACETMGGANIICTDKTGTLTENKMKVTKIYDCKKELDLKKLNDLNPENKEEISLTVSNEPKKSKVYAHPEMIKEFFKNEYYNTLKIGLGVNVVATVNDLDQPDEYGRMEELKDFNKTDFAFIVFLQLLGDGINALRKAYYPKNENVKQIPFSSKRKRMTTLIESSEFPTGYRLFTKGGADFLLRDVTKYLDPDTNQVCQFDSNKNEECLNQMKKFNAETLRTLSVCYKDISKSEYESFKSGEVEDPDIDKKDLILIAIFGIKDVLRTTVPSAVERCHRAGVDVIMVTGDNLYTAVAIGKECNIIDETMKDVDEKIEKEPPTELKNEEEKKAHYKEVLEQCPYALTGNTFYNIIGGLVCETCGLEAEKACQCARTAEEAKQKGIENVRKDRIGDIDAFKVITKNMRVLARSQPVHKYSLVLGFKTLRHVVAVTGDGTNDAPALSKSDVGFAMGKAGTDIAKEASDIIILDDDFASIIVAILWGRNIYDNIRKFLQFQLTVNFCACILVFLCACIGNETPLIPIQMLWVNLIMDSLGSLSLATESPHEELLLRKPTKRSESIINGKMWKHIIFQGIFQLALLLFLYLKAPEIIKEEDPVRLAENAIIQACYKKMPGRAMGIDHIIHGSSSKWDSSVTLRPNATEITCGDYAKKQDLSVAYKFYNNINSGTVHMTMVFNVFVFYTLFNQINSRILDDGFNIFKRIFTNPYFPIIFFVEAILQILIVLFGRTVFHTCETGLSGKQWGYCIGFSLITFVVRIIAILIPVDRCIQRWLDRNVENEEKEEKGNDKETEYDKKSVSSSHRLKDGKVSKFVVIPSKQQVKVSGYIEPSQMSISKRSNDQLEP